MGTIWNRRWCALFGQKQQEVGKGVISSMLGGGRPPSRGRGGPGGRRSGLQEREDGEPTARPARSVTRPYSRSTVDSRPTWQRRKPNLRAAPVARKKSGPSQQVLARAAAIRERVSQFARDGSPDSSSEGEEEEEDGREVVKRLLKLYYQDLGSQGKLCCCMHRSYIRDVIGHPPPPPPPPPPPCLSG